MAGHSKWANIRHRKAAVDKKRGKIWTKCSRAIIVAARAGGGDPDSNLALRYAIDEARYANMPRDTIERAIKKGSGELTGDSYESVRYEGYGPGGSAIIVDALTDNRTRTASDVRSIFAGHGGNLGTTGCVGYLFTSRGRIVIPGDVSEERVMELAIAAGADDVESPDAEADAAERFWTITTEPQNLLGVKDAFESAKISIVDAQVVMIPSTTVRASGENAKLIQELVDALEDLDDVQKVHGNFDFDA